MGTKQKEQFASQSPTCESRCFSTDTSFSAYQHTNWSKSNGKRLSQPPKTYNSNKGNKLPKGQHNKQENRMESILKNYVPVRSKAKVQETNQNNNLSLHNQPSKHILTHEPDNHLAITIQFGKNISPSKQTLTDRNQGLSSKRCFSQDQSSKRQISNSISKQEKEEKAKQITFLAKLQQQQQQSQNQMELLNQSLPVYKDQNHPKRLNMGSKVSYQIVKSPKFQKQNDTSINFGSEIS